jgi:SDR family mycofactocin-dependent oxidoreductase
MNAGRFTDKVAFITGAARGQGRAEAVRLAAEGADIIAVDICRPLRTPEYPAATPADLNETVRLVKALGRRIVAAEADVRDFQALSDAVSRGIAELGRLDIVVVNAGIATVNMAWDITLEQWHETMDVNVTGAFYTVKIAMPFMIEQGTGGSIIMTSSVAGLRGVPFLAHYVASKHAIVGLARALANEQGQFGIRVNTILPGTVATDMLSAGEINPLLDKYAETLTPIYMNSLPGDASEPEDIANAVAWLASDEARHITGIQLPVDLGRLVR